ncbi:hypothetical protein GGR57DRAFT_468672 [Xylariaceae sp. FL1272]|nr:hypothetical protein GGR57DRAFT_468672 [Xylariaceae sp. FL1272]
MIASLRSLPRRAVVVSSILTCFVLALTLWHREYLAAPQEHVLPADGSVVHELPVRPEEPGLEDVQLDIVVASTKSEDTSWFHEHMPLTHKSIYVVDDATAALTVPENKGRESMVYLTYIIDNYDKLPQNMVFVHASRFAWHNDDPDYDALPALRNLQLPYLQESGYANLRCAWVIGCPREIHPVEDAAKTDGIELSVPEAIEKYGKANLTTKHVYKQVYEELFPGLPVPELVAVSCCSQFGVTRDTVRSRPKEDYVRYRDWLLDSPLWDDITGRIFEFSWHIIFHKEAYHCPAASECYCKTFGYCDLACDDESGCGPERYVLPGYSTLPKGWPLVGWEGEERNFTGPL